MKKGKGDIRGQKRRARERKLQSERAIDTDEKMPNDTNPDIKDSPKDNLCRRLLASHHRASRPWKPPY